MGKFIKKTLKTIFVVFVGLVIIGACSGGESVPDHEKYNVQNTHAVYDGYFASYITGTLVADKDYDYLQIEIPCYDENGNNIGSALANVNNLRKGETWKFEAMILERISKYNVSGAEITGW